MYLIDGPSLVSEVLPWGEVTHNPCNFWTIQIEMRLTWCEGKDFIANI